MRLDELNKIKFLEIKAACESDVGNHERAIKTYEHCLILD
jgi:hypothetical protein